MPQRHARTTLAIALFLLVPVGARAGGPTLPERPLGLTDAEFWEAPDRTREAVAGWIDTNRFRGLLIDAPRKVVLEQRPTVPVFGWFVRSLREDQQLDLEAQLLVLALDVDTGEVRVARALDPGKHRAPVPHDAKHEDPGDGTVKNSFATDLRRVLDLPRRPARLRVVALLGELLSNPTPVELMAPEPAAPSELVEVAPSRAVRLGGNAAAPPIPETTAIRLQADGAIVRASFRLPRASPRLRITLLATGRRAVGPYLIPVDVPASAEPGATVSGRLSVDMAAWTDLPAGGGPYHVYALGGGIIAGPATVRRP